MFDLLSKKAAFRLVFNIRIKAKEKRIKYNDR